MRGSVVLAMAWGVAFAQPPLIAIVQSGEGSFYADAIQRFHQTLREQGITAQTLAFTLKGDRTDKELPRRILERKPALIFAVGTDAARLMKDHYTRLPPAQQVPVVFALVVDPVGLGLIDSPERSGGRFVGVALAVRPQRQLRALLDVAPSVRRVGVVYNSTEPVFQQMIAQARDDAARLNLTLVEAPAETPAQVPAALANLQGKVDALWLIPDPVCVEAFPQILNWTMAQEVPVLAFAERFVREGALMGVGVDMAEQGALAAELAARILNGARPEEMPLLTPRRLLAYYNRKTARELNIEIPPMLLNLAQKVYE